MSQEAVVISRASHQDLDELLALLAAVELPDEGVVEHLDGFLVARDSRGDLVGCIGLERYGRLGLLRSAAVAPGLQRSGVGSRLTSALLRRAMDESIAEVLLLTSTARDFFAERFGFTEANRTDYDERLAQSPEWGLPRCSAAVLMRLDLTDVKR